MSAFLVDPEHICLLVQAAAQMSPRRMGPFRYYHFPNGRAEGLNYYSFEVVEYDGSADATVAMLWRENLTSLGYRYPDTITDPGALPGPCAVTDGKVLAEVAINPPKYKAPHYGHVPPVLVLKALDCYEYQSCEHAGWESSQAHAFCETLRGKAIRELPGYDDAPAWPYTGPPAPPKRKTFAELSAEARP